jgi:FkbM family methyltransferase
VYGAAPFPSDVKEVSMDEPNRILVATLVRLGQATFFGRGPWKKLLVKLIVYMGVREVITLYKGVPYAFNLDNTTESKAVFGRYNETELSFLLTAMHKPGLFLDIGANSGFYTQYLAAKSPLPSTIIAIEPNPKMVERIERNLDLLKSAKMGFGNTVLIEKCAVGGSTGTVSLGLESGFGMAHVISEPTKDSIEVPMLTLMQIIKKHDVKYINCLKIDVEGYEDAALVPFFNEAPVGLFPRVIVIEHTSQDEWHTNILSLLAQIGYRETGRTRSNCLLRFRL